MINTTNAIKGNKEVKVKYLWRFESDDVVTTSESTSLNNLVRDISFLYTFKEKLNDTLLINGTQTILMEKRNGDEIRGRFIKITY